MGTNMVNPIRGSTAARPLPHHRLADTMRAIGVFADTAFRVVVLGADATRQPDLPQRDRTGR